MSLVLIGKDLALEGKQRTNGFQDIYIYNYVYIYIYMFASIFSYAHMHRPLLLGMS